MSRDRNQLEAVVARIERERVVPVLSADSVASARRACSAIVAGGLSCVEITFRTAAAPDAIRHAVKIPGLLVGAGTVTTSDQARAAYEAGAAFAVSPGLNEQIVTLCATLGMPFFPGIATPSELDHACALGCRTVKVFPIALLGGPEFVKALASVYRDVRFLPTGGVALSNLRDYLAIPSVLACGGSWICNSHLLEAERYDEIERLARDTAEATR